MITLAPSFATFTGALSATYGVTDLADSYLYRNVKTFVKGSDGKINHARVIFNPFLNIHTYPEDSTQTAAFNKVNSLKYHSISILNELLKITVIGLAARSNLFAHPIICTILAAQSIHSLLLKIETFHNLFYTSEHTILNKTNGYIATAILITVTSASFFALTKIRLPNLNQLTAQLIGCTVFSRVIKLCLDNIAKLITSQKMTDKDQKNLKDFCSIFTNVALLGSISVLTRQGFIQSSTLLTMQSANIIAINAISLCKTIKYCIELKNPKTSFADAEFWKHMMNNTISHISKILISISAGRSI